MTLWLVFALMTAAAIFAVLWPLVPARPHSRRQRCRRLSRPARRNRPRPHAGLIGEAEAEAARIEVSRRLDRRGRRRRGRAAGGGQSLALAPTGHRRCRAGAAAGRRRRALPGARLAAFAGRAAGRADSRRASGPARSTAMISQVEAHLERNPNDARGYEVLAPVYLRIGPLRRCGAARAQGDRACRRERRARRPISARR